MSDSFTPAPPPQRPRFQGVGWRFASVAALTVIMVIPLLAVSLVIDDHLSWVADLDVIQLVM